MIGIGLMCKAPRPGEAKTRLARSIGDDKAAQLAAAFIRDVAARLALICCDTDRARLHVFFRPAGARDEIARLVPPDADLTPQVDGDLGEVMRATLRHMLSAGARAAFVMGSDVPTMPPALLHDAISLLERPGARAVFTPAADGGYVLVGLNNPALYPLLDPLPWSTPEVMDLTRARARALGMDIAETAPWHDVDDADDLDRLRDELRRDPRLAPATRAALAD